MKSLPSIPSAFDLVLVGGGHANVEVLRSFGMNPEPGVRITTIAREPHSPYSGMLPGHIAGHYQWSEIHIDLVRLAQFSNSRLINDSVAGLDPGRRVLHLEGRPDVRYDLCVINTGGLPGLHLKGADSVVPVKPIGRFLPRWEEILRRAKGSCLRLLVVGGGAGGVELSLAIKERHRDAFELQLVTASDEILEGHSRRVRGMLLKALRDAGIAVTTGLRVAEAGPGEVVGSDGRRIPADEVLWTAGVEAPSWPKRSGLEIDADGFIKVDSCLRSISHPDVLAAGDIASLVGQPRPKAGVYAVRAGTFLARNSRHLIRGEPPEPYKAQARALAIFGIPGGSAVASRGWFCAQGKLVWRWKEWIDRKFMDRFNEVSMEPDPVAILPERLKLDLPNTMRCGGCGSKLGSGVLDRVLSRLREAHPLAVSEQIGDDCALVEMPTSRLVTTCDGFRPMVTDPWKFGRIAAHHALSDVYAMGASPEFALALVSVPLMADPLIEDELFQVMSGAVTVFEECGVQLVGGHSSEGLELSIGFSITGSVPERLLRKSDMTAGQSLVLTKPLGTGVLLAGGMDGRIPAKQVLAAVEAMDSSSGPAVEKLLESGATACTDVTGFGLLGHAAEMARASACALSIEAESVPLLDGVIEAFERGIESSLQKNNERTLADFHVGGAIPASLLRALVDPQTSGGLLASIPTDRSGSCVDALRALGFRHACIIGETGGPSSRVF